MPRIRPFEDTRAKAPESVSARMLARFLGVSPAETVAQVCDMFHEVAPMDDPVLQVLGLSQMFFPWRGDVVRDLMAGDVDTPLVMQALTYDSRHIAVDSKQSGIDSLWVVAEQKSGETGLLDAVRTTVCRGFVRTFRLDDGIATVVAVQLSSCQQH